jgi:cbb3-type cytochrome oxidase maturation protein
MESLYLLIPLSVVLVLAVGGLLVWAAMSGQFDGLEQEGRRILDEAPEQDAPEQGEDGGPRQPSGPRK